MRARLAIHIQDGNVRANANAAVVRAVDSGRLAPATVCEACGSAPGPSATGRPRVVYHHHSYERQHWLDVIPLCLSCHRRVHGGSLVEPRTGVVWADNCPAWVVFGLSLLCGCDDCGAMDGEPCRHCHTGEAIGIVHGGRRTRVRLLPFGAGPVAQRIARGARRNFGALRGAPLARPRRRAVPALVERRLIASLLS